MKKIITLCFCTLLFSCSPNFPEIKADIDIKPEGIIIREQEKENYDKPV